MSNALELAWLFPDILNLHGDRGNILALKRVAEELGLDLNITAIGLEDEFNPLDYDIIYASAGELRYGKQIVEKLNPVKEQLDSFIKQKRPLLVTGNTVTLFGHEILRQDGSALKGLGLIDIHSIENPAIYGDDVYMHANYDNSLIPITGIQIKMSDIIPDWREKPFGTMLYGYGHNGETEKEGILRENSIFTELVGPLLVYNPWLADHILRIAAQNKGIEVIRESPDFEMENDSQRLKIEFIFKKKTKLKDCSKRQKK